MLQILNVLSINVLVQSEVAEFAARYNLLLGSGGAEDDTSGRLQNVGRHLRI